MLLRRGYQSINQSVNEEATFIDLFHRNLEYSINIFIRNRVQREK